MTFNQIQIGELYRLRDQPNYCFAKAIEKLPARTGTNTSNKSVIKCLWSIDKNFDFALIKHFSPKDLIKAA